MKRLLSFLCLAMLAITVGCATRLEPGGAYAPVDVTGAPLVQPDFQFYVVDAAFELACSTFDAAVKFEKRNEAYLWKLNPNIKLGLDKARPVAFDVGVQYARARSAYLANPVPANLSQMQALLARLQQIAATATTLLPKTT
jgi:hypothetical protein